MKRPGRPAKPSDRAALGPIHRDSVYPLQVFGQYMGQGHKGIATAKRQGLRVIKLGRMGYVLGSDALAFFEKLADQAGEGKQ